MSGCYNIMQLLSNIDSVPNIKFHWRTTSSMTWDALIKFVRNQMFTSTPTSRQTALSSSAAACDPIVSPVLSNASLLISMSVSSTVNAHIKGLMAAGPHTHVHAPSHNGLQLVCSGSGGIFMKIHGTNFSRDVLHVHTFKRLVNRYPCFHWFVLCLIRPHGWASEVNVVHCAKQGGRKDGDKSWFCLFTSDFEFT